MLEQITRPTLLLNESRVRRNLARMAEKARRNGVRLRPHFKTHQSAQIGDWFRAEGVEAITVSSLTMANYFAEHGWRDITVAFPVNLREMQKINHLAASGALHLLVESEAAVAGLAPRLEHNVGVWIEIDTGHVRSGLSAGNLEGIAAVASAIRAQPRLILRGLLSHTGQSYACRGAEALTQLYAHTVRQMNDVRAYLQSQGFHRIEVSLGDTPMASVIADLYGIDELRPGNYVFYDVTMVGIGACTEDDIAAAVACPVVAKYPERNEVVIYGGAVHLSKDSTRRADGSPDFGWIALLDESGWRKALPDTYLRSLSQEHGVIRTSALVYEQVFSSLALGDLVAVLPIHSCLTADLHKRYLTFDGARLEMMTML